MWRISHVAVLIIGSAIAALLSSCVPKPDDEPFATVYVEVIRANRGVLDASLSDFAERNDFEIAVGDVGSNDQIFHTIHLVRGNAQVIAVDAFNRECFSVSLYGAGLMNRMNESDKDALSADIKRSLSARAELKLLMDTTAKSRNC
jgi:hypothetical protein